MGTIEISEISNGIVETGESSLVSLILLSFTVSKMCIMFMLMCWKISSSLLRKGIGF